MRILNSHDRFDYVPIHERPDYAWPDGNRLAVYIGFNLEHFEFGGGLGAKLAPSSEPDVMNYSWREYGNRVGALINTALYDHAPQLMAALRGRGDEIIGHGHTNAERQNSGDEAAERQLIISCTERISAMEGQAPRGWLSPWIAESLSTPDLLRESGYGYTLNWAHDDQPTMLKTRSGTLWSIPYPQELNDIPMLMARQMDIAPFVRMIEDQFDEMLRQSAHQPLVMGIALHPYLIGQPYRLKLLRLALQTIRQRGQAWWTTPGRIFEHVQALHGAPNV